MDELHRRLLRIGFEAGHDLGLVLAGGYALAAYELIDRPSKDIDFATSTALPLPEVLSVCLALTKIMGSHAAWSKRRHEWLASTSTVTASTAK
jgi:Nucleotidyl transferase AbiEii toxin, Type IV TA system